MFAMDRKQPTRTRPGNDRYSTFTTCQGCRGMSRIGPTPDLNRLLIQRAHRSQVSSFRRGMYGAITALLLEPSETGPGCASPVRCDPFSGVSGVRHPAVLCVLALPTRRLRPQLRQISVTTRTQLVEHAQKRDLNVPLLAFIDRGSSVLAQSGRPSRKENRKTLYVLCLVCLISDCICDC